MGGLPGQNDQVPAHNAPSIHSQSVVRMSFPSLELVGGGSLGGFAWPLPRPLPSHHAVVRMVHPSFPRAVAFNQWFAWPFPAWCYYDWLTGGGFAPTKHTFHPKPVLGHVNITRAVAC